MEARKRCGPISNNGVENHIRPLAPGRSNGLFAGSLPTGAPHRRSDALRRNARSGLGVKVTWPDASGLLPAPAQIRSCGATASPRFAARCAGMTSSGSVNGSSGRRSHSRRRTRCHEADGHFQTAACASVSASRGTTSAHLGVGGQHAIEPTRCSHGRGTGVASLCMNPSCELTKCVVP
jgi:hypothetical protein